MTTTDTTNQAQTAELIQVLRQRATTYGLLSRLFRKEVDQELLDELHDSPYRVSTGNTATDEGNRLMATYLSGMWENTPVELAADYNRVFFGHGYNGHAAAYPFESVYTSEKRLLMQDVRDEVLALYRAAGLEKQPTWKEGEDHIALELEYMQVLGERAARAVELGKDEQAAQWLTTSQSFLDEHLLGWTPVLTEAMRGFAKTDFYRAVAYLTEGWLQTDEELLQDLLADED